MTAADQYPSITIVAGPIRYSGPGTLGHLLRMGDGAGYISITPEVAAQWLPVIETIANEKETN